MTRPAIEVAAGPAARPVPRPAIRPGIRPVSPSRTPPRTPYGTPGRAPLAGVRYVCTVDKKNAMRAGAVAAGTTLMMLLMSSPALALTRDDGDDPGPGLSAMETIGLYVVAPIVLFLVITGLVMVLDKSKKQA